MNIFLEEIVRCKIYLKFYEKHKNLYDENPSEYWQRFIIYRERVLRRYKEKEDEGLNERDVDSNLDKIE